MPASFPIVVPSAWTGTVFPLVAPFVRSGKTGARGGQVPKGWKIRLTILGDATGATANKATWAIAIGSREQLESSSPFFDAHGIISGTVLQVSQTPAELYWDGEFYLLRSDTLDIDSLVVDVAIVAS